MTVPDSPGVEGIDVSGWQGHVDWQNQWKLGHRFAYIKATEGVGFRNAHFTQQYNGAYKQGFIRGAYHFGRPDLNSGAKEAEYFVKNGGGWSNDGKTLPGVLDIEFGPTAELRCWGRTPAQLVNWIDDFVTTYKKRTGREAVIYTNYYWWQDCTGNSTRFANTNSLWLARYSNVMGPLPGGWSHHTMWQYSDTPIDQNRFNGTLQQLKDFAKHKGAYRPDLDAGGPDTVRVSGAHRYETAANLAGQAFARADTAYIASGDDFADALAIGPSAAQDEGPLLLSDSRIRKDTIAELKRLKPQRIVVAGGPDAVAETTLKELKKYAGKTERWAGEDRYRTAIEIAHRSHPRGARTVYVASGSEFADGLAASPAAAANEAPLLLTAPTKLPRSTAKALKSLGVQQIRVVGGATAVSDDVVEALEQIAPTTRIAGENRYETATAIANHAFSDEVSTVVVASGDEFPDALTGGAYAGRIPGPVLLTRSDLLPRTSQQQLSRLEPDQILVLGGEQAVSKKVLDTITGLWRP